MKTSILAIASLFFCIDLTAQVIFRNDFVLTRGTKKIRNLGITTITINLSRHPNLNMLINGRGGRTLVLDVRALNGKRDYTYSEIAEKIYTPPMFTGGVVQKVPAFLLMPPKGLIVPRLRSVPVRQ